MALPLALGPLDMTHGEFYRLTPREFHERLEGWRWRVDRRDEREAQWVAMLVNPHVRERVTASKILGRPVGVPTPRPTSEE